MTCPACGHIIENGTIHLCPPQKMSKAQALQIVIDAADSWKDELLNYIAPASEEFEDTESAQNQRQNADDIADAIAVLRSDRA